MVSLLALFVGVGFLLTGLVRVVVIRREYRRLLKSRPRPSNVNSEREQRVVRFDAPPRDDRDAEPAPAAETNDTVPLARASLTFRTQTSPPRHYDIQPTTPAQIATRNQRVPYEARITRWEVRRFACEVELRRYTVASVLGAELIVAGLVVR